MQPTQTTGGRFKLYNIGGKAMENTHTFYIAGVQHHRLHTVIEDINEGNCLHLVPEPANKFDPNAVRIEHKGTMLGYVPRKFSSEISGMIEIGIDLECVITELNKEAKPWEMCKVAIKKWRD